MSINKKIYLIFLVITFIIYISLPIIFDDNSFNIRLFAIFPLLFFGAFLFSSNSNNENSNFLNILLNQISNDMNITVNTNSIVYTIENAKLYPISNLRESIFLNIVELNSSKIIALCPLFEEVD